MSVMLPNGNFVSPETFEGLKEITRKVKAGEPIITRTVDFDGTVRETVLWSPDDPVAPWLLDPPAPLPEYPKAPWVRIAALLVATVAVLTGLTLLLL